MDKSPYNGAEHHVDWLRGQLRGHENEVVERAITTAQAKDAHNLHTFLEAFVEAYFAEQGSFGADTEIKEVLSELLQRHWKQLISQGLVPYLSLKSLQVRTSVVRDRLTSSLFILIKKQTGTPHILSSPLLADALFVPLFIAELSTAVVPRGP